MNVTERFALADRLCKRGVLPPQADSELIDALRDLASAVRKVLRENSADVDSVRWSHQMAIHGRQMSQLRFATRGWGYQRWNNLVREAQQTLVDLGVWEDL